MHSLNAELTWTQCESEAKCSESFKRPARQKNRRFQRQKEVQSLKNKKAPEGAFVSLVAGAGFEPATFRL
jgi:hypothetical protein